MPAVRRPRLNQTKDYINDDREDGGDRSTRTSVFVDPGPVLDGPGNSFTTYLTNSSGKAVTVRESDGIHITLAGADLVTPVLLADIDQLWHLPH